MTETAQAKTSIIDEFKSLNIKQVVAIIGSLIIAIIMQTYGIMWMCLGFLIIAAILYMVPHMTGVTSVKIKTVIGVVFVIATIITSMFVTGPTIVNSAVDPTDIETDDFGNVTFTDNGDGTSTYTMDFYVENVSNVVVECGTVTKLNYGQFQIGEPTKSNPQLVPVTDGSKSLYRITWTAPLEDGKVQGTTLTYEKTETKDDGSTDTTKHRAAFIYDNGADSGEISMIAISGLWVGIASTAATFFIILIFSALIRRSAEKSRVKMEADGRLYPKGYGRCKQCGGMVLPGEVNCRKCGAYIDVPEELRAVKKDYFICEACGAEVPNDADICPKCGAKFDGVENEVEHADGTVDVSEETFECSECGAQVPANATRCPKCGAKFDEDEDKQ